MTTLAPRWVVLRRDNGNFESVGALIEGHGTIQEAYDRAKELSGKHHGKIFVVCALIGQFVFEPVMIQEEVTK